MTDDAMPPLNPTRVFEVTARLGSITRAAEELVVTPAAVSRQVRSLEKYLGTSLFTRAAGGLQLTEAGSFLFRQVGPAFRALARAAQVVVDGAPLDEVMLHLVSPATFAVRWLIPRLDTFHELHPTIRVSLRTSAEPVKLDGEVDGGVELGLRSPPHEQAMRLIPNVLVPVAAPGQIPGDTLTVEGLAEATLLHSLARLDDWAVWLDAFGATNVRPRAGMRYENSMLAYQAAIEGHGVALAQLALVRADLAQGTLVTVSDVRVDRGSWTYYFIWPGTSTESAALRLFRRWLACQDTSEA